jgi:hypothetical protein
MLSWSKNNCHSFVTQLIKQRFLETISEANLSKAYSSTGT